MKQLIKEALVLVAAALMLSGMAYWESKRTDPVQAEIDSRVVKIQMFYPGIGSTQGSGTKIGNNLVLTNAHLFLTPEELDEIHTRQKKHNQLQVVYEFSSHAKKATLKVIEPKFIFVTDTTGHTTQQVVLISSAPKADYAFLSFAGYDYSTPVKLAQDWHYDQYLRLKGNPVTADFVEGRTKITGFSYLYNPMKYSRFLFVYPCNTQAPGFSGSGIYNDQGELMGIAELGQESPSALEEILYHLHLLDRPIEQCMAIPIMGLSDEINRRVNGR